MIEHSLSFSEIPQSIVDMARKRFEADPQIRFMRIQQNMCVREHNIHKAMDIGAEIENLFARVMQTYLEDSEDESEVLNLTEQQFPEKDRRELMEIVLTLFLATDIIDTATMDFNDVLHRTDKTLDIAQFEDIRKLSKAAKEKLEWFSKHTNYMKGLDFADKSDNMYELLRNKARSLLNKKLLAQKYAGKK